MKLVPYANVVGNLIYAQVCTRVDIDFELSTLGKHLFYPSRDHYEVAKEVMRYLKRIKDYMLTYQKVEDLKSVGNTGYDFVSYLDDRKFIL